MTAMQPFAITPGRACISRLKTTRRRFVEPTVSRWILKAVIEGDLGGDAAGNVETRFAYIDFELPFDPASRVYMGLMPVGAGSDWVFDDNAMGVKVARSMGPRDRRSCLGSRS